MGLCAICNTCPCPFDIRDTIRGDMMLIADQLCTNQAVLLQRYWQTVRAHNIAKSRSMTKLIGITMGRTAKLRSIGLALGAVQVVNCWNVLPCHIVRQAVSS